MYFVPGTAFQVRVTCPSRALTLAIINCCPLGESSFTSVKVSCTPLPGYVCTGASATANVPNDLDPTNNHAHST